MVTADVDLNHAFGGAKSARSPEEAEEFVTNLLWQMQGFPAQLRQRAHGPAARAVAAYPAALRALAALTGDAADGTSGADRVDGHGETTGGGDD